MGTPTWYRTPRVITGGHPGRVGEVDARPSTSTQPCRADVVVARDVRVDTSSSRARAPRGSRGPPDDALEDPSKRWAARRWNRARTNATHGLEHVVRIGPTAAVCRRRRAAAGAHSIVRCARYAGVCIHEPRLGTCEAKLSDRVPSLAVAIAQTSRPRSIRLRDVANVSTICGANNSSRARADASRSRFCNYVMNATVRGRFGMALLTQRDPMVVGAALASWIPATGVTTCA